MGFSGYRGIHLDKGRIERYGTIVIPAGYDAHCLHGPVRMEPPAPLRPEILKILVSKAVHIADAAGRGNSKLFDSFKLLRGTATVVLQSVPHIRDGLHLLSVFDTVQGQVNTPITDTVNTAAEACLMGLNHQLLDDLRIAEHPLEVADPRLHEPLLVLRGVVLGVLADVAVLARNPEPLGVSPLNESDLRFVHPGRAAGS